MMQKKHDLREVYGGDEKSDRYRRWDRRGWGNGNKGNPSLLNGALHQILGKQFANDTGARLARHRFPSVHQSGGLHSNV